MRLWFFAVVLLLGLVPKVEAQEQDIRGVIGAQIEAFQKDDFARAFSFAAPSIQRLFQTPENFQRMVTGGYPMVWRPAAVEYLDLRRLGAVQVQIVQVTDGAGQVHLLAYSMIQVGVGWRIAGVEILREPDVSA